MYFQNSWTLNTHTDSNRSRFQREKLKDAQKEQFPWYVPDKKSSRSISSSNHKHPNRCHPGSVMGDWLIFRRQWLINRVRSALFGQPQNMQPTDTYALSMQRWVHLIGHLLRAVPLNLHEAGPPPYARFQEKSLFLSCLVCAIKIFVLLLRFFSY